MENIPAYVGYLAVSYCFSQILPHLHSSFLWSPHPTPLLFSSLCPCHRQKPDHRHYFQQPSKLEMKSHSPRVVWNIQDHSMLNKMAIPSDRSSLDGQSPTLPSLPLRFCLGLITLIPHLVSISLAQLDADERRVEMYWFLLLWWVVSSCQAQRLWEATFRTRVIDTHPPFLPVFPSLFLMQAYTSAGMKGSQEETNKSKLWHSTFYALLPSCLL